MKIGLEYRNEISWVVEQFDKLIAAINGIWKRQHLDNGAHGDVTATSLGVGTITPLTLAHVHGGTLRVSNERNVAVNLEFVQLRTKQWGFRLPAATTRFAVLEDGADERLIVLAGGKTIVGTADAGTGSKLEVIDTDALIGTISTSAAAGREGAFVNFLDDNAGTLRKAGVLATTVADGDATSGYFATNIHTTYLSGGVGTDDIWLVGWGNRGAAFFPSGVSSASAPGVDILRVNGTLEVTASARTGTGSTGSIASGTPTTIFAATAAGLWQVVAYIANAGAANYTAAADVLNDSTNARITANNGGLLTLTLSGTNVQVTQNSGAPQAVSWSYLRMS
jgi:hypothetical protein